MAQEIYDVFISYARKDYVDENKQILPNNIISKIKKLFEDNDISYWFDESGIYSGDAFAAVLAQNIRTSKIFLFISSKHSNASEWTSNEIATAHAYKKKIIPFKYDDSVFNESVIMYIAKLDFIENTGNEDDALARLLISVKNHLEVEKQQMKAIQKKQEEEEQRAQRAQALENCRRNIDRLCLSKEDLEKQKEGHEKALLDIDSKIKSISQEIATLREEELKLSGSHTAQPKTKDERSLFEKVISKELEELKTAFKSRHWLLNIYEVILFVSFSICGLLSMFFTIISSGDAKIFAGLTAISYLGFIGSYRLMKNKKDSLYWLIPLFPILAVIALMLCLRKNRISGMKMLHRDPKPLQDDIIYVFMIFILIVGLIGMIPVSMS